MWVDPSVGPALRSVWIWPLPEKGNRPITPSHVSNQWNYQAGAGTTIAASRQEVTMRIAQVAPLYERVPPQLYGGTERVVSYLTEELVRLGHDVALFASGDSRTQARLEACCPRALRLDPDCHDPLAPHVRILGQ